MTFETLYNNGLLDTPQAIDALLMAIRDIRQHNEALAQYTPDVAALAQEDPEPELPLKNDWVEHVGDKAKKFADFNTARQGGLVRIQQRFGMELTHMGLSANYRTSEQGTFILGIEVQDAALFTETLKRHASFFKTTSGRVSTLLISQEILSYIVLEAHSGEHTHTALLEHLGEIAQTLGSRPLAEVAKRYKAGELDMYLRIPSSLWGMPGSGYGPTHWVEDTTPEELQKEWANATRLLNDLFGYGYKHLGEELLDHFIVCGKESYDLLEQLGYDTPTRERLRAVLAEMARVLTRYRTVH